MKLREMQINNFRSFENEIIKFDNYTCLVGPNGSGKSTVLQALNVFFRNTTGSAVNLNVFSEEDFHHKNTEKPIEISLTFEDLTPEAQEDFKAYYRNGKLIVSAIAAWDGIKAEVKQYGSRLVMTEFASYFSGLQTKARAKELKDIYSALREIYNDLPNISTKADMEYRFDEAHKLFLKLSNKGDRDAQNNLGAMYQHGHGVPVDNSKAAYWYLESARLGNVVAQFNISIMLFSGKGVQKDKTEALAWMLMAQLGKLDKAPNVIKKMKKTMNPNEIRAAKNRTIELNKRFGIISKESPSYFELNN